MIKQGIPWRTIETHTETRNNTKTNVHTTRNAQHTLKRGKTHHDAAFKKTRNAKHM
jgi:hypothetical protein